MTTKVLGSFTWDVQSRMHSPQARPKTGFGDGRDFDELGMGQGIPIHEAKPLVFVPGHGKAGRFGIGSGNGLLG
jgi:hypothetical protein